MKSSASAVRVTVRMMARGCRFGGVSVSLVVATATSWLLLLSHYRAERAWVDRRFNEAVEFESIVRATLLISLSVSIHLMWP